jgi:hypothetical protein
MKQTAVDWLQQALEDTILDHEQIMQTIGLFEQAKAMHKEEVKMIIEHYHNSLFYLGLTNKELKNISEMIYNETFG